MNEKQELYSENIFQESSFIDVCGSVIRKKYLEKMPDSAFVALALAPKKRQ